MAITKSIIELTDSTESCEMVKRKSTRRSRFDDYAAVFYDNNRHRLPTIHNRPLYITESVKGVKLKRAALNQALPST